VTEIQQNRYDALIRRVNNIVAPGSMVADALSELFPMIDVENVPIELLALMGTIVATAGSILSPSAADINKHQLFNPVDSHALLVLTTLVVSTGVAGNAELATTAVPLTDDVGNVIRRDTRSSGALTVVGQNRSLQSAAGIPSIVNFRLEQNVAFTLQDPNGLFVLFPGFGVTFSPTTANVQSICQFFWRERVFEPSEDNL